jgi:hypothetical protein
LFDDENERIKATTKMVVPTGVQADYPDTSIHRIFRLVPKDDKRANGSSYYFDNAESLKQFINNELENGTLFSSGKSKVMIILEDGAKEDPIEPEGIDEPGVTEGPVIDEISTPMPPENDVDSDGDGVLDSIDRCDDEKGSIANSGCPKVIKINLDGPVNKDNRVSWNKLLADKSKFQLTLSLIDGTNEYLTEDVSGKSGIKVPDDRIVGHNNNKTTVRLTVTIMEPYTSTSGDFILNNQKFYCKTFQ